MSELAERGWPCRAAWQLCHFVEARELFEREYLMTQINRFGGNISRTASFVGMERSALHRKLKSLNVVTSSKAGGRVAYVDEDKTEAPE